MSYCFDAKQEVCAQTEKNKHAMFYGMLLFADKIGNQKLQIITENVFVINLLEDISSSLFGVHFAVSESANAYVASLEGEAFAKVCAEYHIDPNSVQLHFDADILDQSNAASAFLKGAFLIGGSVTNPYSAYHLELVTHYYQLNKEIMDYLLTIGFSFKSVMRKSHYVIYLKDSTEIERFLYVLGAKQAAFDLVNAKIYKQVQNDNNRLNNCEGYNRDKTMDKSILQLKAIEKIKSLDQMICLSEDLREVAKLRTDNPYASLSQLQSISGGKFSKAGLSRRLKKIIELAEQMEKEDSE